MPPINPEKFIEEHGEKAVAELLFDKARYVASEGLVADFCSAVSGRMPLLLQGGTGTGKTAFREAVVKAFELPSHSIHFRETLSFAEACYGWHEPLRKSVTDRMVREGVDFDLITHETFTGKFVVAGELLKGFLRTAETGIPSVVGMEELDKTSTDMEDGLLELLESGCVTVPRLTPNPVIGCPRWENPAYPIIIGTSNNSRREVSEPVISRMLVRVVQNLKLDEMVRIVELKLHPFPEKLLKQLGRIFFSLHHDDQIDFKPNVRELLALCGELRKKEVESLTLPILSRHVSFLARTARDQETLRRDLEYYMTVANSPNNEVDGWFHKKGKATAG